MQQGNPELRFQDGRLVPNRNLLEVGGRRVRLEPQVAEVLACLMRSGGQVLGKEEIIRRVWEGRAVSDDALVVAIYELRKALGDDARRPTFIETIPRRGYRWLLPVETIEAERPTLPLHRSRRRALSAGLFAVAALLVLALVAFKPRPPSPPEKVTPGFSRTSVPDLEPHVRSLYLSGVHLQGRRSSADLKRASELFEQVVALAPSLASGHAALAQTYAHMADRNLGDRFSLYFQARSAAQRALELDPDQARAHVALAMVTLIFDWNAEATEISLARARELEPDHADAYQILAWLRSAQGRGEEAEEAARHAIELDPITPSRYGDLAFVLSISGRPAEALAVVDRALELDPAYVGGYAVRSSANLLLQRPAAAVEDHQQALRLTGAPESFLQELNERYRQEGLAGYLRHYLDHLPRDRALVVEATLLTTLGEPQAALDRLERAADRHDTEILWAPFFPELAPLRDEPRFRDLVQRVSLSNS